MTEPITPGGRFDDPQAWEAAAADGPHIWRTLGYRRTDWRPGSTTIEWLATPEYSFPTAHGQVVQGGLVTALLDAAMGGACWTVLDNDQVFLTADLRVEFLRVSNPGLLSATGTVVRRTRRVVFCAAEMRSSAGELLAASRCTQVVLPDSGSFGRFGAADQSGAPPEDARG
ncbi:MAG: PaaI family thioesterase [Candidatus Dormibacteraeota bacterium]|nr:PaaI family thioesterase [Candidatus Dormibacteraeota bacterium]